MLSRTLILAGAILAASATQQSQVQAMTMPADVMLGRREVTVTETKTATKTQTQTSVFTVTQTSVSTQTAYQTVTVTGSAEAGPSSIPDEPPSSSSAPAASLQRRATAVEYPTEVLGYHNTKRALHNTPALSWSDDLAQYAGSWGSKCEFKHGSGSYGENLAAGAPSSYWNSQALFDLWYAEGEDYDYSSNVFDDSYGHFTQLLWKDTTQVGCALVTCSASTLGFDADSSDEASYLVCEYSPAGNIDGEYTSNVLPLASSTSSSSSSTASATSTSSVTTDDAQDSTESDDC